MKKIASTLLTEDRFWEIIENSNKGEELKNELSKLSEDEIFGYKYWWDYFHRKSYKQELWAVAYAVMSGCSDDGFDYFRCWLITRGKLVYMNALQDADSLCEEFALIADGDYPEREEASYVPLDVLEEKFDIDFYEYEAGGHIDYGDISLPEIAFEWSEDDEGSIRKICPKTFDKWWGNDKF